MDSSGSTDRGVVTEHHTEAPEEAIRQHIHHCSCPYLLLPLSLKMGSSAAGLHFARGGNTLSDFSNLSRFSQSCHLLSLIYLYITIAFLCIYIRPKTISCSYLIMRTPRASRLSRLPACPYLAPARRSTSTLLSNHARIPPILI